MAAVGEPVGQELEEIRVYSVSNPDVSLLTSAISTCRTFLRDVFLPNFRKRSTLKTSFLRITPLNDDGQVKGELVRQIARDWMQLDVCMPAYASRGSLRIKCMLAYQVRERMQSEFAH